jgi:hypothetical protein
VWTLPFDTLTLQQWYECSEPGLEGPNDVQCERSDELVPEDGKYHPPNEAQDRRIDQTDQCKTDSEIHVYSLK